MAQVIEEPRKVQYPLDPNSYKILDEIGTGVSAIVYKAICLPMNSTIVAIKAIDLDQSKADLDSVRRETKAMSLLSHQNILKAHCSFTVERRLWVVMPFMSAGSLQSIISSSFPDGFSEPCIAFVLRETLNALLYLHNQGHLHRDIKAGNILVDADGSVKLGDFGVSASIYESNLSQGTSYSSLSSSLMLNDVTGTPYWMAPEVIHSHTGYGFKADIWSFGITALELAHGRPPLSHLPPSKSLIMRITNRFRLSDYERNKKGKNKKFSKAFREVVSSCLTQDPSKRPTAEKLLKHPFFRYCKNADFLVRNVLQGLPTVEERFKQSRLHRPLPVAGDGEESSVGTVVKHRRISGWNFNEEVLELDPVFPTEREESSLEIQNEDDSIVKQVRFGGEIIIQSRHEEQLELNTSDPNSPISILDETHESEVVAGETNVDEPAEIEGNEEVGMENPPPELMAVEPVIYPLTALIPNLLALQNSLDEERQLISHVVTYIRGGSEVSEEQLQQTVEELQKRIQDLRLELEQERKRTTDLEMQLESLRRRGTAASVSDSSGRDEEQLQQRNEQLLQRNEQLRLELEVEIKRGSESSSSSH
ncbi:hypothetical protein HHK36_026867 [Tetracentron sinense]|uniref:Protein kinase domain-containing protein n=1 Tax=Tetracentron sinense TaxID=13715 RepID=A0A835D316_TETSI|nr:hypothetical protein HHK36_026867 [Tetracentron sinense]